MNMLNCHQELRETARLLEGISFHMEFAVIFFQQGENLDSRLQKQPGVSLRHYYSMLLKTSH